MNGLIRASLLIDSFKLNFCFRFQISGHVPPYLSLMVWHCTKGAVRLLIGRAQSMWTLEECTRRHTSRSVKDHCRGIPPDRLDREAIEIRASDSHNCSRHPATDAQHPVRECFEGSSILYLDVMTTIRSWFL